MNVSPHQSLVLAGEYLPAGRVAADSSGSSLALPSGGAVLQRVTVVATQPDSTVVLLRADYAAPLAAAPGNTYESLASRAGAAGQYPGAADEAVSDAEATSGRPASPASAYASTASLYSRLQPGRQPLGAVKGGVIDVHA